MGNGESASDQQKGHAKGSDEAHALPLRDWKAALVVGQRICFKRKAIHPRSLGHRGRSVGISRRTDPGTIRIWPGRRSRGAQESTFAVGRNTAWDRVVRQILSPRIRGRTPPEGCGSGWLSRRSTTPRRSCPGASSRCRRVGCDPCLPRVGLLATDDRVGPAEA